jgi:hypothetical protein
MREELITWNEMAKHLMAAPLSGERRTGLAPAAFPVVVAA